MSPRSGTWAEVASFRGAPCDLKLDTPKFQLLMRQGFHSEGLFQRIPPSVKGFLALWTPIRTVSHSSFRLSQNKSDLFLRQDVRAERLGPRGLSQCVSSPSQDDQTINRAQAACCAEKHAVNYSMCSHSKARDAVVCSIRLPRGTNTGN